MADPNFVYDMGLRHLSRRPNICLAMPTASSRGYLLTFQNKGECFGHHVFVGDNGGMISLETPNLTKT